VVYIIHRRGDDNAAIVSQVPEGLDHDPSWNVWELDGEEDDYLISHAYTDGPDGPDHLYVWSQRTGFPVDQEWHDHVVSEAIIHIGLLHPWGGDEPMRLLDPDLIDWARARWEDD
jgi:hypothetical protein